MIRKNILKVLNTKEWQTTQEVIKKCREISNKNGENLSYNDKSIHKTFTSLYKWKKVKRKKSRKGGRGYEWKLNPKNKWIQIIRREKRNGKIVKMY